MSDGTDAPALDLERIEAEEFRALIETASPETTRTLGIAMRAIGLGLAVAASRLDVLQYNRVIGLGVGAPARASDLDRAIEFFRASGSPRFMVNVAPHATPPELPAWLTERGFRLHNYWIKLWRPAAEPVAGLPDPRVRTLPAQHAQAFAACIVEAFGLPETVVPWLAATVPSGRWRHYGAFDGNEPVGFGSLFVDGHVGWLGMASTRASHRKQGIQSALIATRLREAARIGCTAVTVETADDTPEKPNPSTHNLVRMGFRVAYRRPNWVLAPVPR